MERRRTYRQLGGRSLATTVLALLAPATAGAASAPSKPAPAAPAPLVWTSEGSVTVALLTPAQRPQLVAPSYAGWMVDAASETPPTTHFAARAMAPAPAPARGFKKGKSGPTPPEEPVSPVPVTAVPVPASQLSAAIAPPALKPEAAKPSAAPLPVLAVVPLPPKRLAEKRVVLASMGPVPPARPALPSAAPVAPPAAPALAFAPQPPAAGMTALPGAEAVASEVEASETEATEATPGDAAQEDAARPIDDTPEPVATRATADRAPPHIEALIERHAARFDVPTWLVRRVAWRESKFEPSRRNGPYWGLMQIRVDTARALGFRGEPKDLLDADTNMTYAVAYLANAYRVAGRDEKRAVVLYSKGYYYEAKRKRVLDQLIRTAAADTPPPVIEP